MNQKVILLASAMLCSISVFSQPTEGDVKPLSKDLGFQVNIFNGGSLPFAIMMKKYSATNKALRIGASIGLSAEKANSSSNNNSNAPYSVTNGGNMMVSIGKEIQENISKNWMWYYGGDILLSYGYTRTEQYDPQNTKTNSWVNSHAGITARPFLGLRFNIQPRLYISTEFSANLSYNHQEFGSEAFNPSQVSNYNSNTLGLYMTNAATLLVFYKF